MITQQCRNTCVDMLRSFARSFESCLPGALRPVQTVMLMIVDDSFNDHSLSSTIMFAIKRSVIVHDSLSKSRNVLASLTGT